jgi:hypothetical protein
MPTPPVSTSRVAEIDDSSPSALDSSANGNCVIHQNSPHCLTQSIARNIYKYVLAFVGALSASSTFVHAQTVTVPLSTDIKLPGGNWGAGYLAGNIAPLFSNSTFTGATTQGLYTGAGFGAFLQQTDDSSCGAGADGAGCVGFAENLYLDGPGVIGGREAAQINLIIAEPTGNTQAQDYVGIGSQCNLMATDAAGTSSCFGNNPVSHIGNSVIASQNVGEEIDTWEESGAVITDRIGMQIVDVMGSTYGTQATRDDVALSLNNQYNPSATLGFRIGLEVGRFGGAFPVASGGTLIFGQGKQGAGFTVANGIDLHKGTFTGNAYNDGHVVLTGSGRVGIGTQNPNASLHVRG